MKNGAQTGRVFVSYSRRDRSIAEALRDELIASGFDAYIDLHDVAPGEPWKERLRDLISSAESVVFLVSSTSSVSEICAWEIDEAERQGKKLLPILIEDTPLDIIPGRLVRLNLIHYRTPEEKTAARSAIVDALSKNLAWEREKTRINELATTWKTSGELPRFLTLRKDALHALEAWRDERPETSTEPTELHLRYISESRNRFVQRQRLLVAISAGVALVTASLAVIALVLRSEAVDQRDAAVSNQALIAARTADVVLQSGDSSTASRIALASWHLVRSKTSNSAVPNGVEIAIRRSLGSVIEKHSTTFTDEYPILTAANGDVVLASSDFTSLIGTRISKGKRYDLRTNKDAHYFAWRCDEELFITGDSKGTVALWAFESFEKIFSLDLDQPILSAVCPSDNAMAVAQANNVVRVFERGTSKEIFTLEELAIVATIPVTPKGFFAGRTASGGIVLIDVATKAVVAEISGLGGVAAFDVSSDGRHIAYTTPLVPSIVNVFDVNTGAVLRSSGNTLSYAPIFIKFRTGQTSLAPGRSFVVVDEQGNGWVGKVVRDTLEVEKEFSGGYPAAGGALLRRPRESSDERRGEDEVLFLARSNGDVYGYSFDYFGERSLLTTIKTNIGSPLLVSHQESSEISMYSRERGDIRYFEPFKQKQFDRIKACEAPVDYIFEEASNILAACRGSAVAEVQMGISLTKSRFPLPPGIHSSDQRPSITTMAVLNSKFFLVDGARLLAGAEDGTIFGWSVFPLLKGVFTGTKGSIMHVASDPRSFSISAVSKEGEVISFQPGKDAKSAGDDFHIFSGRDLQQSKQFPNLEIVEDDDDSKSSPKSPSFKDRFGDRGYMAGFSNRNTEISCRRKWEVPILSVSHGDERTLLAADAVGRLLDISLDSCSVKELGTNEVLRSSDWLSPADSRIYTASKDMLCEIDTGGMQTTRCVGLGRPEQEKVFTHSVSEKMLFVGSKSGWIQTIDLSSLAVRSEIFVSEVGINSMHISNDTGKLYVGDAAGWVLEISDFRNLAEIVHEAKEAFGGCLSESERGRFFGDVAFEAC